MREEELDGFDEEELEMLISGLIHPGDMVMPPDLLAGAYPAPATGLPGGMPHGENAGLPGGFPLDDMIARAYDELEDGQPS